MASGAFLLGEGRAHPCGEASSLAFLQAGRSEGLVEGTWRTGAGEGHYGGLVFRLSDARNFYLLRANSRATGAELALYACQEGVWAPLGSAAVGWQPGQSGGSLGEAGRGAGGGFCGLAGAGGVAVFPCDFDGGSDGLAGGDVFGGAAGAAVVGGDVPGWSGHGGVGSAG